MTLIFLAIFECSGWGCLSALIAEMYNFLNVVILRRSEKFTAEAVEFFLYAN